MSHARVLGPHTRRMLQAGQPHQRLISRPKIRVVVLGGAARRHTERVSTHHTERVTAQTGSAHTAQKGLASTANMFATQRHRALPLCLCARRGQQYSKYIRNPEVSTCQRVSKYIRNPVRCECTLSCTLGPFAEATQAKQQARGSVAPVQHDIEAVPHLAEPREVGAGAQACNISHMRTGYP